MPSQQKMPMSYEEAGKLVRQLEIDIHRMTYNYIIENLMPKTDQLWFMDKFFMSGLTSQQREQFVEIYQNIEDKIAKFVIAAQDRLSNLVHQAKQDGIDYMELSSRFQRMLIEVCKEQDIPLYPVLVVRLEDQPFFLKQFEYTQDRVRKIKERIEEINRTHPPRIIDNVPGRLCPENSLINAPTP